MNPIELQSGDRIIIEDTPLGELTVTDVDVKELLTTVYGIGIVTDSNQYVIEGTTASDESTVTDVHNTDEWIVGDEAINLIGET